MKGFSKDILYLHLTKCSTKAHFSGALGSYPGMCASVHVHVKVSMYQTGTLNTYVYQGQGLIKPSLNELDVFNSQCLVKTEN